jgi:hypothetical protein
MLASNVIAGQRIERKLTGDCPACFTRSDMERLVQMKSGFDHQALCKMLDTGICVIFKKGQSIFVEDAGDLNMSAHIIPIRTKGQLEEMWTVSAYTMGVLGTLDKP